MSNNHFSQEQIDRLENGWDESKQASIVAAYPQLSNNDWDDVIYNVEESVFQNYDLESGDSIMEIFESSAEGIANERAKEES